MRYQRNTSAVILSLAMIACSVEPRPLKPDLLTGSESYDGDGKGRQRRNRLDDSDMSSSSSLPSTPVKDTSGEVGDQESPIESTETTTDSANLPLSVSVSLSPINLSTPAESYFGRGTRMKDGTLVVSYGQDVDSLHTIKTEISKDDGKTWQAQGEVIADPFRDGVGETVGDPTILLMPSGTMLSFYRNEMADGTFRLQSSASTDGGRTWRPRGDVDSMSNGGKVLHPTAFLNSRGQAQVYYSKSKNPDGGDLQVVMKTSGDEGKTWTNQVIVATRPTGSSAFPAPIRLRDGSIMVSFDSFRGENDTHLVMRYVQSNNDGLTWTASKEIYVPANGEKNANSPQVVLLDDGRPIVVFMSDEDTVPGEGCCAVKMMIGSSTSSFEGVEWAPQPVTAVANGGLFPSVFPGKDGSFFLVYERSRTDIQNVRIVQIHRVSIKGGL